MTLISKLVQIFWVLVCSENSLPALSIQIDNKKWIQLIVGLQKKEKKFFLKSEKYGVNCIERGPSFSFICQKTTHRNRFEFLFFLFLFYSLPVANIGIAICIAQQKVQLNSNFVMETPKKKSKNLKLKWEEKFVLILRVSCFLQ